MGWFLRKSVRFGPVRINFSKRGIGMSAGAKGLRVGTGPRGPYVAGGRGGIYFRQQLGSKRRRATASAHLDATPAARMLAAQPRMPPAPSQAPVDAAPAAIAPGSMAAGHRSRSPRRSA